jgi:hypothetical protein
MSKIEGDTTFKDRINNLVFKSTASITRTIAEMKNNYSIVI